jgi:hypothetical protein
MAKLTDEAKKAIAEIPPSLVAIASGTEKPNVSAKGSLRVTEQIQPLTKRISHLAKKDPMAQLLMTIPETYTDIAIQI